MGAAGVAESPGRTQAIVTKKIREMKNIRFLFMTSSLTYEIKKPPGNYSREASWNSCNL
jgi:hypothetical protein